MNTKRNIFKMMLVTMMLVIAMQMSTFAAAKMNKKSATIKTGETVELKVNTKAAVSWKSSNKKVATVDKKGKVTGVKAGKTTIKAKVKGSKKVLKCKVTVVANQNAENKAANAAPAQKNTSAAAATAALNQTGKNSGSATVVAGASTAPAQTQVKKEETQGTPVPVMSEEEIAVYQTLMSMKSQYPEGMRFTNADFYMWNGGIYVGGYGCAAFSMMMSDEAFDEAPAVKHTNFENVKVGDIIRLDHNTHSVIVLKNNGSSITVAEGNYNEAVHWGRVIPMKEVKTTGTYVLTRY